MEFNESYHCVSCVWLTKVSTKRIESWIKKIDIYCIYPYIMCAVYNTHPYFGLHFEKKKGSRKQRKWLCKTSIKIHDLDTLKKRRLNHLFRNVTWCTGDPWNNQFFRWILLAASHCKIMDTVCHPLHPALRLLKEHYGLENWGQSARN